MLLRAAGATLGQGHLLGLPLGERAATEVVRPGLDPYRDMVDVCRLAGQDVRLG